ncbi:DinB family protein [soil metagenome]
MDTPYLNRDTIREDLAELLLGGFAPVVILLREFDFNKAGIVLEGLHFSAYSLLGHMHIRQQTFLNFLQDPDSNQQVWPEAYWPQNFSPSNEQIWEQAISDFEKDLEKIIQKVKDPLKNIFTKQANDKTIFWAVISNIQHNAYHIGQIKTIGRQLGVW